MVVAAAVLLLARAALAGPPPAYDDFIDSAQHPIRVHYTSPVGTTVAEQVLAHA